MRNINPILRNLSFHSFLISPGLLATGFFQYLCVRKAFFANFLEPLFGIWTHTYHSCLRPHQKIIGTAFSIRLRRLADFYSENFSSGTLCNFLQPIGMGNRSKSPVSTIPPLRHGQYITIVSLSSQATTNLLKFLFSPQNITFSTHCNLIRIKNRHFVQKIIQYYYLPLTKIRL